jgi:hypothetical protein
MKREVLSSVIPRFCQPGIIALDLAEWALKSALAETPIPQAQHHAILKQQRNRQPTTWCL